MPDALTPLLDLGALDRELKDKEDSREAANRRLSDLEAKISRLGREVSTITHQIKENLTHQRIIELDLQANTTQLKKIEEYQNKVKSNQEYRANVGRIAELKKAAGDYEDRLLAFMESHESLQKKKADVQGRLSRTQEALKVERINVEREVTKLAADLEALLRKRAVAATIISTEVLDLYEKIRKMRGEGLAEVNDRSCQGCFVTLTLNQVTKVMLRREIQFCPSCSRALFIQQEETRG